MSLLLPYTISSLVFRVDALNDPRTQYNLFKYVTGRVVVQPILGADVCPVVYGTNSSFTLLVSRAVSSSAFCNTAVIALGFTAILLLVASDLIVVSVSVFINTIFVGVAVLLNTTFWVFSLPRYFPE